MKKTTTPCSSLQGSSARERRYSSTAVGFPIRNDQKAHSQRVSEGFPSWVGARCAHTYVQGRENCVHWHSERLNKSLTEAYIPLAYDVFTPNERPQNCPQKPAQRLTIHPRSTTQQRTMPRSATHNPPTKHHSAANDAPPDNPQSTHEAILVRLRFAYGSLGSHLTQLSTHPAPVHHTFRANSQTHPGSFTIH
jgi:hypothetical protein